MIIKTNKIPIFFAVDDNYVPYLTVALRSLIDNANQENKYSVYILNNGLNTTNKDIIYSYQCDNFEIEFVNVCERLASCCDALDTRDYYTKTTYFRFFIQTLFPQYDKALYLDADIVVLGDISKLYNVEIGDNFLGAIPEQIVASVKEYRDYSKIVLGLDYRKYFNAGILVMNLKKFREYDIEQCFIQMIKTYKFETIAQDQDYLNFIAKDKVTYIPLSWNKECVQDGYKGELNLIHYALFKKPWTYYGIKYDKYFWQYAVKTVFYDLLFQKREKYTNEQRSKDKLGSVNLKLRAKRICKLEHTFYKKLVVKNYQEPKLESNDDLIGDMVFA
ncbi:MAG: glycosyltransferase family 8 protein [Clostridia bacterium]